MGVVERAPSKIRGVPAPRILQNIDAFHNSQQELESAKVAAAQRYISPRHKHDASFLSTPPAERAAKDKQKARP